MGLLLPGDLLSALRALHGHGGHLIEGLFELNERSLDLLVHLLHRHDRLLGYLRHLLVGDLGCHHFGDLRDLGLDLLGLLLLHLRISLLA